MFGSYCVFKQISKLLILAVHPPEPAVGLSYGKKSDASAEVLVLPIACFLLLWAYDHT